MDNYEDLKLDKTVLRRNAVRVKDNVHISLFYGRLGLERGKELDGDKFLMKADRINNCMGYWFTESFPVQNIVNVTSINLCGSKFCKNCQNHLAETRFNKFFPLIEKHKEDHSIFHAVFTVKNVPGTRLVATLNRMYKKFPYLIDYLKGKKKIKGLDLTAYGYAGAIRSLEITSKKVKGKNMYHPHFHCAFLLKKGLKLEKNIWNVFSNSHNNGKRKFSDFEITLQKIWYLILHNTKVTKKNIEKLDLGYDITFDKVNKTSGLKEVFKYTLKDSFSQVSSDFDVFNDVRLALKDRRIIQGYGLFYGLNFYEKALRNLFEEEVEEKYQLVLEELKKIEEPFDKTFTLKEIINMADQDGKIIISKSSIRKFIKDEKNNSGNGKKGE